MSTRGLANPTGYAPSTPTGYGQQHRLMFSGDESSYELWEVKFLGHMRIHKLHDVILPATDGGMQDADVEEDKNAEAFATLVQCLDDRSLALVIRDAKDNGREALKILRQHYLSQGKPRVIALYTELTSLSKKPSETITDYVIRAETASALLKSVKENISDSLLIAMVLKGLPNSFKPFSTVVTQKDNPMTFSEFKVALRNYEDTEKLCYSMESDNVLQVSQQPHNHPFN